MTGTNGPDIRYRLSLNRFLAPPVDRVRTPYRRIRALVPWFPYENRAESVTERSAADRWDEPMCHTHQYGHRARRTPATGVTRSLASA
jgi:hypothetical protein